MASVGPRSSPSTDGNRLWSKTWRRAVLPGPLRRTVAVWLGVFIVLATTIGGNGLAPSALVAVVFGHPVVGAVLAAIWLLLLWPAARELRCATGARYLRSLPAPRYAPIVWTVALLLFMQLPIAVLCVVAGAYVRAVLLTVVGAALLGITATLQLPARTPATPVWRSRVRAQLAIWMRGVWRNSGASLLRSAGFVALAGLAAGGFIRANQLRGNEVSTFGATVLYACLVPALAPLLAELVNVRLRMRAWDAALGMIGLQRQIAWVVACSGLVACLAAVAALIAFAIAGIDFLDGARLFGFACAGGSMVGALMARGSLWAMQRERSVFSHHGADARTRGSGVNLVIGLVVVTLATGITIGLLAEAALLPLGAAAVWAVATTPRNQT